MGAQYPPPPPARRVLLAAKHAGAHGAPAKLALLALALPARARALLIRQRAVCVGAAVCAEAHLAAVVRVAITVDKTCSTQQRSRMYCMFAQVGTAPLPSGGGRYL